MNTLKVSCLNELIDWLIHYQVFFLFLIVFVALFCRTSATASGVALEGLAIPKWNQQLMEQNAVITR